MMMLGQLIMSLVGERDSWDMRSLTAGMGGGGGGMGMGMGGGGGRAGGGFRSVPPAALASALVKPGQTRRLPTPLVRLSSPSAEGALAMPRQGEPLAILDVDTLAEASPRLRAAVKQLAGEKAPQSVAQLVLWHVGAGLDWSRLGAIAQRWANPSEQALARRFVAQLDRAETTEAPGASSTLELDLGGNAADAESQRLANEFGRLLDGCTMLGLTVRVGPIALGPPRGPAVACRGQIERGRMLVRVLTSDEFGTSWRNAGDFSLALGDANANGTDQRLAGTADALAEGLLNHLVRGQLIPGPRVKGKETYKIRIDNASPLVLDGLALAGSASDPTAKPSLLLGISLPPRKSLTVPATADVVNRLRLKQGIRVQAVDLSGL
jgi:hypothetical protein